MPMSDHQDSEHFSYDREWTEIEQMLDAAERVMNQWVSRFYQAREKDNKTLMRELLVIKKPLRELLKLYGGRWEIKISTIL